MNKEQVYNQIIMRAKLRGLNRKSVPYYTEKHHIVPKCLGGTNDKSNLVLLTAKEHFICHKLLAETFPDNPKLGYALWSMANMRYGRRGYIIGSREYARLRKKHSDTIRSKPSPNKGKKHTAETRAKMSEAMKGKKQSAETIAKRVKANTGRKRTAECIAKIKGRKHTAETIAKRVKANTGRKRTAETRAKISEAIKGKKHTAETIAKMRRRKRTAEQIAKTATCNSKPVLRYSLNGKFEKEYPSVASVIEDGYNSSCVSGCLTGRLKTSGNKVWKCK